MPDFENDAVCINLDKKIGFYAEAVRNRQIDKRLYLKKNGYRFDVNSRFPYPYDDNTERRLINEIDSYLMSFPETERAEVNGHFLKEYQNYLSTPFAKHARELIMWSVRNHPLQDKDKFDFLNYVFLNNKHGDFDKKTLYKLGDYNPNTCLEQTNRFYIRMLSSLGKGDKKKDEDAAFINGMLNIFTERVETVSPEMAVNYAKIYFRLADKSSKILSPWPLGKLATKTPKAKTLRQGNGKKNLDKETMNLMFEAYAAHIADSKGFNENLAEAMFMLAEAAVETYEYTPTEVKKLADIARKGISADKRAKAKNDEIVLLAHRLEYLPANPLAGTDLRDENFRPSKPQILGYADYLCRYAAYYPDKEVKTDNLMFLLERHAHLRRLDIEEATFFRPAYKKKAVDKSLVLEIATIYGQSLQSIELGYEDVNAQFGSNMSKMLENIVANYNYNGREARAVSNAVSCDGKSIAYAQKTGKDIFAAYTAAYKRRYRALKSGGKEL